MTVPIQLTKLGSCQMAVTRSGRLGSRSRTSPRGEGPGWTGVQELCAWWPD